LLILRKAPPAPFIPQEFHGKPIAAIAAHWTGDPADGVAAIAPLKASGSPVADTIGSKDFMAFQSFLDGGQPFGRRYYWKSDEVGEVSDGLMATLTDRAARIASPFSAILMMHMGGAPARVAPEATAVGIRGARYGIVAQGAWIEPGEDRQHVDWARDTLDCLKPFSSGAPYANFLTADEGDARVLAAYGKDLYERLRRVKATYDPENIFRGNANIRPAGS